MNGITAIFNTTTVQMIKMSQWPKCLIEKMNEISPRKKTGCKTCIKTTS